MPIDGLYRNLPTLKSSRPIKSTSQLALWLNNLPLQDSVFNNALTIFWSNSGKPYALRCSLVWIDLRVWLWQWHIALNLRSLYMIQTKCILSSVDHKVCRVLVTTHVRNEVDSYSTGSLIVKIPI